MTGATSFTVILTVALPEPTELVPVIVYEVVAFTAVGVPESTQVVERERPAGKVGDDEQEVAGLPVFAGVWAAIAVPFIKVNGVPEKLRTGAANTTMETLTFALAELFVAVIV
jgi:hypothetical protein